MRGFDVELDQLLHPASIFSTTRGTYSTIPISRSRKSAPFCLRGRPIMPRCVSRPEPNDRLPSMRSWTRCAASTTIQIGHVLEGSRCGSRDGAGGETTKVQAVPR